MSRRPAPTDEEVLLAEAKRVSSLRMQMLEMHPFWGYLLLQVKLVPAVDLPTFAATDCIRHIWYNPHWTRHLTTAQLGFVLAHEVGHQLFASQDRQRGRAHQLWNCATDYAINRIVADIGHPARPGAKLYSPPEGEIPGLGSIQILLDDRWNGMIAEAIYEYLAADELPDPVSITLELPERGDAGEGNIRIPNLTDHCGGIDVHLPDNLSPQKRDELVERIAGALETWERQERAGDIPGDLVREILVQNKPSVPWQRIFRQFSGQAVCKDDYSLCRPNKRYLADDVLVPGLYAEKVGQVVVSVDTSGSMTKEQLEAVGAELKALLEQAVEMTLIVADSVVQEVVGPDNLERFLQRGRFRGGGGTDHRPVFEWIRKAGFRPDLYVGLTDLYSEFPQRRPPYPVVWLSPDAHGEAPWGKVIEVQG